MFRSNCHSRTRSFNGVIENLKDTLLSKVHDFHKLPFLADDRVLEVKVDAAQDVKIGETWWCDKRKNIDDQKKWLSKEYPKFSVKFDSKTAGENPQVKIEHFEIVYNLSS